MFGPWWKLSMDTAMLAFESQAVIGLRMAKLAAGGAGAQAEMQRMVSEKMFAAGETAMLVASGGSTQSVVSGYRRKVRANQLRLTGTR
ncbi:hypothetical protein [Methylobacterium haplocladii]|uniref:Phasin domain-containing protein n=1 Tax=Methylobacterium haplocladii TaxID=1176176 RepID=A0A512ILX2_9HYPH|nr:hypothetical protein [Methylobacterium haplocladii]GEO98632.1 hypothetical protein MHA02_10200 [Methylobacterium haplocladii]GJD83967.1 hypothetical protein HPGCJGGD_1842 [Methylobacterium haplocladii]GLS59473.1 hypothetical protein GCM10007887_21420 [Methylobacterium haplocladii]